MQDLAIPTEEPSFRNWYAVQTNREKEAYVSRQLIGNGYDALHVICRVWIPIGGRYRPTVTALFPQYIFARLDQHGIYVVSGTHGAKRVVSFDGEPFPVPETFIQELEVASKQGIEIKPPVLREGDKVRFMSGPFEGLEGIVDRNERRKFLITLLTGSRVSSNREILEKL